MISLWIFTVILLWMWCVTHFRLSHLKRINPLIILWLQTLFDSLFWVIKYASTLFSPFCYLKAVEDALVLGHEMCRKCDWVMCNIISWTYLEDIIPGEDMGTVSWNIYLGRVALRWQWDGVTEWNEVERGQWQGKCLYVRLIVFLSVTLFPQQI